MLVVGKFGVEGLCNVEGGINLAAAITRKMI
jgi:hypothetical protein